MARSNQSTETPRPSKGSERLKKRLAEHGEKDQAARELGVSAAALNRWVHGYRKPNASSREKLRRRYRIGWADWDVPASVGEVAA